MKEACDTAAKTTAAVTEAVQKVAGVEVTTDNISVRQDVKWIDGWVAVCESAMWVHGASSGSWVGTEGALRVAAGQGDTAVDPAPPNLLTCVLSLLQAGAAPGLHLYVFAPS